MSHAEIIRAWKDPEYRSTLSVVPTHPAGVIELPDPDLGASAAARDGSFAKSTWNCTNGSCTLHCTRHCGF